MPTYVELRPMFKEAGEPETFFYEVMDDRSVRRRIIIVSGGGYRWDDVRAHTDPNTLLGVGSCIEKPFPTDEGWDHREVAYIHLDASDFEAKWRAALAEGVGPLNAQVHVPPHY